MTKDTIKGHTVILAKEITPINSFIIHLRNGMVAMWGWLWRIDFLKSYDIYWIKLFWWKREAKGKDKKIENDKMGEENKFIFWRKVVTVLLI